MEGLLVEVQKKARKGHFPWTAAREFTFVNLIFKEKGHLRTDINMIDKFNSISSKLRLDASFTGREFLDGPALKKKWERISGAVESKYSLSSEGANLSGLEEQPSELEKLVMDLLKERHDTAKAKDEQKLKDQIRNQKMLTHEKSMLNRQDKKDIVVDDVSIIDDNSEVSDVLGTVKKKPRIENNSPQQLFDFEIEIVNALKDDPRIIELEVAERRHKLDDSIADKAHMREMEMKRMVAEERMSLERSKAELERSKADQAIASAQMKMMEMFTMHMNK